MVGISTGYKIFTLTLLQFCKGGDDDCVLECGEDRKAPGTMERSITSECPSFTLPLVRTPTHTPSYKLLERH